MATATFAAPRIAGALSATKTATWGGGAGAASAVFSASDLAAGPLKDLLSASYSGASAAAAQTAALAAFNANIRAYAVANGANTISAVKIVPSASLANPSALTLTVTGTSVADGDTLDVTVLFAASATL